MKIDEIRDVVNQHSKVITKQRLDIEKLQTDLELTRLVLGFYQKEHNLNTFIDTFEKESGMSFEDAMKTEKGREAFNVISKLL